ncbi:MULTISPECIES: 3-keto-disaccharide hydrolase [Maribacter]|uniref:DUF1080 domain-containing protein n=1 Tax=Maribacter flavus TaxID=1658664 RepID=A0A5B2TU17_9FLAO|nr:MULTISPECIES: DUF1080 domain-containing protein [Maribacter]KAA2217080.1 DUF1080 domain-containing protein [Maribacter flavus]MDC6405513.1 DUF1080 domain-containing protein [Maribacter sp. PR66]MEE1972719.1 DUF1080 domain-containing protein [Maribacter flavus]
MKKILGSCLTVLLLGACGEEKPKPKLEASTNNDWVIIFDGNSTDALRGYGIEDFPEGIWYVENGALIANPDTTNRDLVTKQRFRNFELEYEWAVDTAANSGVFFHMQEDLSMEAGNGNSPNWLDNYELQILDDENFYDTLAVRSAGSLYDLIKPVAKELKPIGDFNRARLVHNNGHVEHWLNGNKVIEFEMNSPEMKKLLNESKFKENPDFHSHQEGHIMFQHHGQRVYFKNIRAREIE